MIIITGHFDFYSTNQDSKNVRRCFDLKLKQLFLFVNLFQ